MDKKQSYPYINKILNVYAADEAAICFFRRKLTMNYILN